MSASEGRVASGGGTGPHATAGVNASAPMAGRRSSLPSEPTAKDASTRRRAQAQQQGQSQQQQQTPMWQRRRSSHSMTSSGHLGHAQQQQQPVPLKTKDAGALSVELLESGVASGAPPATTATASPSPSVEYYQHQQQQQQRPPHPVPSPPSSRPVQPSSRRSSAGGGQDGSISSSGTFPSTVLPRESGGGGHVDDVSLPPLTVSTPKGGALGRRPATTPDAGSPSSQGKSPTPSRNPGRHTGRAPQGKKGGETTVSLPCTPRREPMGSSEVLPSPLSTHSVPSASGVASETFPPPPQRSPQQQLHAQHTASSVSPVHAQVVNQLYKSVAGTKPQEALPKIIDQLKQARAEGTGAQRSPPPPPAQPEPVNGQEKQVERVSNVGGVSSRQTAVPPPPPPPPQARTASVSPRGVPVEAGSQSTTPRGLHSVTSTHNPHQHTTHSVSCDEDSVLSPLPTGPSVASAFLLTTEPPAPAGGHSNSTSQSVLSTPRMTGGGLHNGLRSVAAARPAGGLASGQSITPRTNNSSATLLSAAPSPGSLSLHGPSTGPQGSGHPHTVGGNSGNNNNSSTSTGFPYPSVFASRSGRVSPQNTPHTRNTAGPAFTTTNTSTNHNNNTNSCQTLPLEDCSYSDVSSMFSINSVDLQEFMYEFRMAKEAVVNGAPQGFGPLDITNKDAAAAALLSQSASLVEVGKQPDSPAAVDGVVTRSSHREDITIEELALILDRVAFPVLDMALLSDLFDELSTGGGTVRSLAFDGTSGYGYPGGSNSLMGSGNAGASYPPRTGNSTAASSAFFSPSVRNSLVAAAMSRSTSTVRLASLQGTPASPGLANTVPAGHHYHASRGAVGPAGGTGGGTGNTGAQNSAGGAYVMPPPAPARKGTSGNVAAAPVPAVFGVSPMTSGVPAALRSPLTRASADAAYRHENGGGQGAMPLQFAAFTSTHPSPQLSHLSPPAAAAADSEGSSPLDGAGHATDKMHSFDGAPPPQDTPPVAPTVDFEAFLARMAFKIQGRYPSESIRTAFLRTVDYLANGTVAGDNEGPDRAVGASLTTTTARTTAASTMSDAGGAWANQTTGRQAFLDQLLNGGGPGARQGLKNKAEEEEESEDSASEGAAGPPDLGDIPTCAPTPTHGPRQRQPLGIRFSGPYHPHNDTEPPEESHTKAGASPSAVTPISASTPSELGDGLMQPRSALNVNREVDDVVNGVDGERPRLDGRLVGAVSTDSLADALHAPSSGRMQGTFATTNTSGSTSGTGTHTLNSPATHDGLVNRSASQTNIFVGAAPPTPASSTDDYGTAFARHHHPQPPPQQQQQEGQEPQLASTSPSPEGSDPYHGGDVTALLDTVPLRDCLVIGMQRYLGFRDFNGSDVQQAFRRMGLGDAPFSLSMPQHLNDFTRLVHTLTTLVYGGGGVSGTVSVLGGSPANRSVVPTSGSSPSALPIGLSAGRLASPRP